MAIACVTLVTDAPGRVLAGIAAAGLILFAGLSWRARPKLAITPDGLVIRGWFRTQLLQRSDIKIIRITEFRRLARKVRLLEIDTVDGGWSCCPGGTSGPTRWTCSTRSPPPATPAQHES